MEYFMWRMNDSISVRNCGYFGRISSSSFCLLKICAAPNSTLLRTSTPYTLNTLARKYRLTNNMATNKPITMETSRMYIREGYKVSRLTAQKYTNRITLKPCNMVTLQPCNLFNDDN